MSRELHLLFRESVGVRFPGTTRLVITVSGHRTKRWAERAVSSQDHGLEWPEEFGRSGGISRLDEKDLFPVHGDRTGTDLREPDVRGDNSLTGYAQGDGWARMTLFTSLRFL
jgi:hypothetical protein